MKKENLKHQSLRMESLETRQMLTANPMGADNPMDASNTEMIAGRDASTEVNYTEEEFIELAQVSPGDLADYVNEEVTFRAEGKNVYATIENPTTGSVYTVLEVGNNNSVKNVGSFTAKDASPYEIKLKNTSAGKEYTYIVIGSEEKLGTSDTRAIQETLKVVENGEDVNLATESMWLEGAGQIETLSKPDVREVKGKATADSVQVYLRGYDVTDVDSVVIKAALDGAKNTTEYTVNDEGVLMKGAVETSYSVVIDTDGSEPVITISGLKSGLKHKIQIAVVEGESVSDFSTADTLRTLKGEQDAPENVVATITSASSVNVSWEGAEGVRYTIQYASTYASADVDEDELVWKNYKTNLKVTEEYVTSEKTEVISYQYYTMEELEKAKDDGATSIIVKTTDGKRINERLNDSDFWNGKLDHTDAHTLPNTQEKIYYAQVTKMVEVKESVGFTGSYEVSKLKPGQSYVFRVIAQENDTAEAAASEPTDIVEMPSELMKPSVKKGATTDTTATFAISKWDAMLDEAISVNDGSTEGIFISFNYGQPADETITFNISEAEENNRGEWVIVGSDEVSMLVVDEGVATVTIAGLEESTTYDFVISTGIVSENALAYCKSPAKLTVTTQKEAYAAPTNVNAYQNCTNASESIIVTWEAGDTDDALDAKYTVQYRVAGTDKWKTASSKATVNENGNGIIVINKLTSGTEYQFQVKANKDRNHGDSAVISYGVNEETVINEYFTVVTAEKLEDGAPKVSKQSTATFDLSNVKTNQLVVFWYLADNKNNLTADTVDYAVLECNHNGQWSFVDGTSEADVNIIGKDLVDFRNIFSGKYTFAFASFEGDLAIGEDCDIEGMSKVKTLTVNVK